MSASGKISSFAIPNVGNGSRPSTKMKDIERGDRRSLPIDDYLYQKQVLRSLDYRMAKTTANSNAISGKTTFPTKTRRDGLPKMEIIESNKHDKRKVTWARWRYSNKARPRTKELPALERFMAQQNIWRHLSKHRKLSNTGTDSTSSIMMEFCFDSRPRTGRYNDLSWIFQQTDIVRSVLFEACMPCAWKEDV